MNNELLKELIKKNSTPYGNDLVDSLMEDYDAKIILDDEKEDSRGRQDLVILQIDDIFVEVTVEYLRIGYKDYDFNSIEARIVEKKEEVITYTRVTYE